MNRGIKRQKGGAEKKREKSRKLLLADSEKCAKLTDLFFKPPSAASASSTSASTNVQDTEQTDQGRCHAVIPTPHCSDVSMFRNISH